jgi:hypothetical protein
VLAAPAGVTGRELSGVVPSRRLTFRKERLAVVTSRLDRATASARNRADSRPAPQTPNAVRGRF